MERIAAARLAAGEGCELLVEADVLAAARAVEEREAASKAAEAEAELASAQATAAVAEERVLELGQKLEAAVSANRQLEDAKGASDAANEARIADLVERLTRADTARDGFEKDLGTTRDRVRALEVELHAAVADLASMRQSLEDTRSKLESDGVQLRKAILEVGLEQGDARASEGRPRGRPRTRDRGPPIGR